MPGDVLAFGCAPVGNGDRSTSIVFADPASWSSSEMVWAGVPVGYTRGPAPGNFLPEIGQADLSTQPVKASISYSKAQSGNAVSIRQFTNNAFNQHHGIQSEERFGIGADPDGDGFVNEITRADVTAATIFRVTLPVPGRVINTDPYVEAAIANGERQFQKIGCTTCHIPTLPLDHQGWIYTEPNPYNPPGNMQTGDAPSISVDLTSDQLPGPRLKPINGILYVPAYTDLKLHNICNGPDDPNTEPLNQNQPAGSPAFFAGNRQFITRKLWGVYNSGPFMHHGQFTTMRQAILAHHGEAEASRRAFRALSDYDRDSIIEFLKSLQVLAPGTSSLCVDQNGRPIGCPPGIQP
jgi:hypothetical protein